MLKDCFDERKTIQALMNGFLDLLQIGRVEGVELIVDLRRSKCTDC